MLDRALTLKIKARLPRRDFDIMINQFKMTSLPLLILLPPARIIQSRDLHPANHCWVFCISGARHPASPGKQDICIMLVLPSAGTLTRHAITRDLFDGVLVVPLIAHCTGLYWAASLDLMLCLLHYWTDGLMQMSPGVLACPARVIFQVNGFSKPSTLDIQNKEENSDCTAKQPPTLKTVSNLSQDPTVSV